MNNKQKERLERNLSKSAAGAKPYWPRVLIGPSVEKQGYIDPKLLPIDEINLGKFYEAFKHYKLNNDAIIKELIEDNTALKEKNEELSSQLDEIFEKLKDLEIFNLD